jgi:hypothetical protein
MTSKHGTLTKYRIDYGDNETIYVYASPRVMKAYGFKLGSKLDSYDTGGYTGDWGNDGKLAMLHEKELVLNKSDTKNMLTIVDIVRGIISDLNNLTSFGGTLHSYSGGNLSSEETLE